MTDLVVVTPVYGSPSHGASSYYQTLTDALRDEGHTIHVVTEQSAQDEPGVTALFPERCNLAGRSWDARWSYLVQNLRYLRLPVVAERHQPRALLFHSGFLNHPGLLGWVLPRLRKTLIGIGTRMVLDVRDRLAPASRLAWYRHFDHLVSCSLGSTGHLLSAGVPEPRITTIPTPLGPVAVDKASAEHTLKQLGIRSPYVFCAGLVKEEKGTLALLRSFLHSVHTRHPDTVLVLAGLNKATSAELLSELAAPGVHYLGPLPHQVVLELMTQSAVTINPSPSEGLSRASLEALALGCTVVLPPDIPEFEQQCPEFALRESCEAEITRLLLQRLKDRRPATYDVGPHRVEAALPVYRRVLFTGLPDILEGVSQSSPEANG